MEPQIPTQNVPSHSDDQLLDLCLNVTGRFEGGRPSYTALAADFDTEGMSAGILQWNVGSGTLQSLLTLIAAQVGWDAVSEILKVDTRPIVSMNVSQAVSFVRQRFLDPNNHKAFQPDAASAWKNLLGSEAGIKAQRSLAESTILRRAKLQAQKYVPNYAERTRSIAFFFDLCTQQGSMGKIPPTTSPSCEPALTFARTQHTQSAGYWAQVVETDPLARILLYYGNARAQLARAPYVWNCLARRGTIATRQGYVNREWMDFTAELD